MPAIKTATLVTADNLQTTDALPIDRAGDAVPRRTEVSELDTRYGRTKLAGIEDGATADQTGAEIATALNALVGNDRVTAAAIRDLTQGGAGDLTGVTLASGVLTFTRRSGADIAITLPSVGGGTVTGEQVVTLLTALTGNARLPVTAIRDLTQGANTDITDLSIQGSVITATRRGGATFTITLPTTSGGQGLASVASDSTLTGDGTSGSPLAVAVPFTAEEKQQALATGDDAATATDTWAVQYSILQMVDGARSRSIPLGATTAHEIDAAWVATAVQDEAGLGIGVPTGRIAFSNLHASTNTLLRSTGKVPIFRENLPAGMLRLILRPYNALNEAQPDIVQAVHAVTAATTMRTDDFSLGDISFMANSSLTYQLVAEFTPNIAVASSSASFGFAAGAGESHIFAFRRWVADVIDAAETTGEDLRALIRGADTETIADADEFAFADASDSTLSKASASDLRDYFQQGITQGGEGLAAPATVPPAFRDDGALIRVTSTPAGAPTLSYDDIARYTGLRSVGDLAALPEHGTDRVWLTALWRDNHPGPYEANVNPVDRNAVAGVFATRSVDFNSVPRTQYGWDVVAPGTFGTVSAGQDFAPEFYWWQPNGTGTPWVLSVWIPNSFANSRLHTYLEITSSETSTTIGEGLTRTTGRLNYNGQQYSQYQSSSPLSNAEVAALAAIQDASGPNDVTLNFFESADGNARGAPLNFEPAFIWRSALGQHNLATVLEEPTRANRLMHGARILADWGQVPVFPNLVAANRAGVLGIPGYEFAIQDVVNRSQDLDRYIVSRGYPGTGGSRGSVSGRNRLAIQLLQMGNGAGFYFAQPYRSQYRTTDNVQDVDRVDPDNACGFLSFYDARQGVNASVQIGLLPTLTSRTNIWLQVHNRSAARGGTAAQMTLNLTRATGNDATAVFGGRTYNVYTLTLTDQLQRDLGRAGWLFTNDTVIVDLEGSNGGNPININPDELQFTRGSGYAAPTNPLPPVAQRILTRQVYEEEIITDAAFGIHSFASTPAAAADDVVFTWTVPNRALPVSGETLCDVGANFTIVTTGAVDGADFPSGIRANAIFRMERVRSGVQNVVIVNDNKYIRHSTATAFNDAVLLLQGTINVQRGDQLRIVSRSWVITSNGRYRLSTDNVVNKMFVKCNR